ncbi:hypothetical protein COY17_04085 [Candidatus Saccharibacteria bacterium CG_4_10_14_0_2_um_filter_52_9]|nr:MAG: hypothetical protein COY17_04085 [Candidatus Saccharibacteria bacterium CG_4_10_14_0_2_um_filter_52_9]
MSAKTKNTNTVQDTITDIAQQTGIVLMAAATTLGMVELQHEQPGNKVIAQVQPAFATVTEQTQQDPGSLLRRKREEAGPHYVSYSAAQRTPGRTGKY